MNVFVRCYTALFVGSNIELPQAGYADLSLGKNTATLILTLNFGIFFTVTKLIDGIFREFNEQTLFKLAVYDRTGRIGKVHPVKHQAGFALAVQFKTGITAGSR